MKTENMRFLTVILAGLGLFHGLSGFMPAAAAEEKKELVFPAPPEVARIKYIQSLARESDLEAKSVGLWGKILNAVLGRETVNLSLNRPYGVCADTTSVYVADSDGGAVVVFNMVSRKMTRIGGTLEGRLMSPMGVALDGAGRLFVTDSSANTVKVFSVDGKYLYRFGLPGSGAGQLKKPIDIAYDSGLNRLLVSDSGNSRVMVFDASGKYLLQIGKKGVGDGEFSIPVGMAVDPKGRILVSDTILCRVQVFSPEGKFLFKFGEQGDSLGYFARPKGVASDSDGNIYVSDALFNAVQIFNQEGKLLMHFGAEGGEPGAFQLPIGLFVDRQDKVYVADSFNQRVQVFQYLKQQGK